MSDPTATILVVDDEVQNCKLLEALLRPEGYHTVRANNGEEALRHVARDPPDLILLDVMMPGMNGYQVAKALKENPLSSHIPIIMVTAQSDREARLAGLSAGAEEFLAKPVDRAELWIRVRNLLRLKNYADFLKSHSTLLERQVQARNTDLQRFRIAMDSSAEAIMLIELSCMRLVEINACACNMFGYSREELIARGPVPISGLAAEVFKEVCTELTSGRRDQFVSDGTVACRDGSLLQTSIHLTAQRFGNDWIVFGVLNDVTARKQAAQWLHHLAHYDALTGLPNRELFFETLSATLASSVANGNVVALVCVDIDHFKNINDTLGYQQGDELLRQFAKRLVECSEDREGLGRLGGDAFLLTLVMQDGLDTAATVSNRVRALLRAPFELVGGSIVPTVSVGISVCPHDAADAQTLISFAETAMSNSKSAGGDTLRFFTAQMNIDVLARIELEANLRQAVLGREFVLHYQPKVDTNSGRLAGFEALLRWDRPGYGLVPPGVFIAALEESALIVEVGAWVIEQACRQIALWTAMGLNPVQVSVNVSGRQLSFGDLETSVCRALELSKIQPEQLELELTESILMENVEHTTGILHNLRKRGVQISIDDFGTGYSSLAYLRRFSVDKLKIDISFVRDVTSDPDAAAIVLAIIRMAHSLKLEVVGEGVETAAQLAVLKKYRCDQIQGYYFSRPLSADAATAFMREGRCLPGDESFDANTNKMLLLVDENPHTLATLQQTFCEDGYEIRTVACAQEAFELLALRCAQVIMCDQYLPDMSATTFLGRVKDLYPGTLRIILSNQTELDWVFDAINSGAVNRFYTKPWNHHMMRNNLREAFHQHCLASV